MQLVVLHGLATIDGRPAGKQLSRRVGYYASDHVSIAGMDRSIRSTKSHRGHVCAQARGATAPRRVLVTSRAVPPMPAVGSGGRPDHGPDAARLSSNLKLRLRLPGRAASGADCRCSVHPYRPQRRFRVMRLRAQACCRGASVRRGATVVRVRFGGPSR